MVNLIRTLVVLLLIATTLGATIQLRAQDAESDYYKIVTLPIPDDLKLEVSGLAPLPDGRLAATIRKGEVWLIDNAYSDPPANLTYTKFASGLHEPLGLLYRDDALLLVQRSELTELRDTNNDDKADLYTTIAKGWGVTGNYHEYAYGPKQDKRGNLWITLNCSIGKDFPQPDSNAWRGWSLIAKPDGSLKPMSAGMRSPSGLGINAEGDAFFTDQQGNWVPTCSLHHMREGAFHGHADSLQFTNRPESTFKIEGELKQGIRIGEAARQVGPLVLPAVWFPYIKMGMGSTDVVLDDTAGKFGPFENQLFVGDFTLSLISRVYLEKVNGQYQGACFPFRKGFQSAVLRMAFGHDGSMFVGQTNRGWNSTGDRSYGLQRLIWTGRTPFEIKTVNATPTGFKLTFTQPVDPKSATDPASYTMTSYTYDYHATYGSEELDTQQLNIQSATLSPDHLSVNLTINGLRETFVHELHLPGLRNTTANPLLHPVAYYTLNQIPK